jgi:tRNA 2-thiocytidine biosynthesis protein TtcA
MGILGKIRNRVGKAVHQFDMISDGDKILVCFSGGKDSYTLIKVMESIKKKAPVSFSFKILLVDAGFAEMDYSDVKVFLESKGYDFEILSSSISAILADKLRDNDKNPCFLCSRIRRGVIYNYARRNGFNKIALGHNLDDAIETFMMNMFFSYRMAMLKPKYLNDEGDIEVIRPLIFCDEELIVEFCNHLGYVPINQVCDLKFKDSKRLMFRKMLKELKEKNPDIKESAMKSFGNIDKKSFWN